MRNSLSLRLLFALGALGLAAGCTTVELDTQTNNRGVAVAGELRALINADLNATLAAAERAVREEGMVLLRRDAERFEARLVARNAMDQKVRIDIREVNSRQTQLDIRVGFWRDREQAEALYARIDRLAGGR